MTTDSERYSFIVEYLDPHAGLTFRYQLLFWAADSSVEMYDIKNRRSFLKKTRVPSITTKDFFLGATITVYSRQLKVVEYGDAHTERAFASARQRVFALVKPNAIRSAGKIIHAAVASGFVVAECKMATMQRADAERMFGDRNDRALVNDACAGACVGIALVSEDAVAKFAALNGEKGSTDPSTLHGAFGDACVASSSESDAETQCATFFALPSAAKFENTSLCIVKPHAMANLGLIVDGVLEGGFAVTGMQTFTLDRANASEFLEVYKGAVPEYNAMVDELTSGAFCALEVAASDGAADAVTAFREKAGPADPEIARALRPESLRARFGFDKVRNAVHCTDLAEDGALETTYFFKILQSVAA